MYTRTSTIQVFHIHPGVPCVFSIPLCLEFNCFRLLILPSTRSQSPKTRIYVGREVNYYPVKSARPEDGSMSLKTGSCLAWLRTYLTTSNLCRRQYYFINEKCLYTTLWSVRCVLYVRLRLLRLLFLRPQNSRRCQTHSAIIFERLTE